MYASQPHACPRRFASSPDNQLFSPRAVPALHHVAALQHPHAQHCRDGGSELSLLHSVSASLPSLSSSSPSLPDLFAVIPLAWFPDCRIPCAWLASLLSRFSGLLSLSWFPDCHIFAPPALPFLRWHHVQIDPAPSGSATSAVQLELLSVPRGRADGSGSLMLHHFSFCPLPFDAPSCLPASPLLPFPSAARRVSHPLAFYVATAPLPSRPLVFVVQL
mmetsp:Transcript_120090/g.268082  ORF Transcript_120090/g.268082 Transcript_120090/m.268082 type:complete len:218 (-) Transcript_120090:258-911(-)